MKVRKAIINVMEVDPLLYLGTWELSGAMAACYQFACVACGRPLATIAHVSDCGHPGIESVDCLKRFELRAGYARNAEGIYVWKGPPRRPSNMWAAAARGDSGAFAQCQTSNPDFPIEWLRAILDMPFDWSEGQHGRVLDTRYAAVVRCFRCREHNLLDPRAARGETVTYAGPTKYVLRECVKSERGEPSAVRFAVTKQVRPMESRSPL